MNTPSQYPSTPARDVSDRTRDREDPTIDVMDESELEADFEDRVSASPAHDAEVIADAEIVPQGKSGEPPSESWQRIQAKFVDDPRKAVAEAHQLVGDVVQRIVDGFTKERGDLERQWSNGDSVSTEDLRVCLQRYRAFFSRLTPSQDSRTS